MCCCVVLLAGNGFTIDPEESYEYGTRQDTARVKMSIEEQHYGRYIASIKGFAKAIVNI